MARLSSTLYNAAATVMGRHLTDLECEVLKDELPAHGFYGSRVNSTLEHDPNFVWAVQIAIQTTADRR